MQPVSRNIIAAAVYRSTEGAASTVEAGAEGASMAMEKTIKYHNGDTYIGQVNNYGQGDGRGIIKMASGDVYEGQVKHGMFHGEGKYTWADGREYDGEFSNNKMHGKGILKLKDGTVYDGEWSNNRKHGKGKMKYKDGQEYDGEWSNNEHGKGKMKYKDGTEYDVVCNMLRSKSSIEVIWHHLDKCLVLGILMGLWAFYCHM